MPVQVFPLSGPTSFADEFGRHQGTDIFSPVGTPVRAVDAGDVRFGTDPLGGNVANLTAGDGARYYYAHLQGFEGQSRKVNAGDVLGYVGNTGNAAHTASHLHFEIHPGGGAAVDPYPFLAALDAAGAANPPPWAKGKAATATTQASTSHPSSSWETWAMLAFFWWLSKRKG